jgi:hypothetical protein
MKRVKFTKKARVKFPMKLRAAQYATGDMVPDGFEPRPRAQIKRTPFSKKHKVVHKVEDPNAEKKLTLVKKAAKLRGQIFKGIPCALCIVKNQDVVVSDDPHHILRTGKYDRLRFVMMNIMPVCRTHHIWIGENELSFIHWLLDHYPRHYRYYLNEKDNRAPVQQTVESLTKIVADLQYYADHPLEAEQVIYEKD